MSVADSRPGPHTGLTAAGMTSNMRFWVIPRHRMRNSTFHGCLAAMMIGTPSPRRTFSGREMSHLLCQLDPILPF